MYVIRVASVCIGLHANIHAHIPKYAYTNYKCTHARMHVCMYCGWCTHMYKYTHVYVAYLWMLCEWRSKIIKARTWSPMPRRCRSSYYMNVEIRSRLNVNCHVWQRCRVHGTNVVSRLKELHEFSIDSHDKYRIKLKASNDMYGIGRPIFSSPLAYLNKTCFSSNSILLQP